MSVLHAGMCMHIEHTVCNFLEKAEREVAILCSGEVK